MRSLVLLIFCLLISNSVSAQQWQCQSGGGWILDVDGRSIQLPSDPNDYFTVAFVPPNKMQILQSNDPLDAEIYKLLSWSKIGDTFHGSGIYTLDGVVFNMSASMDNTKSVSVATASGHPDLIAAMGIDNCRRTQ